MNVLNSLADIIFPPRCLSCNKRNASSEVICNECADELVNLQEHICTFCQRETSNMNICEDCKREYPFDEVICAYMFNPPIQRLIHNFKYNEFKRIGAYLGSKLADILSRCTFIADTDYIIPVPLHRTKQRYRGFNQSDIIAEALSDRLNIPWFKDVIQRKKFTQTQTQLKKSEREKNVAQAFKIKKNADFQNKSVVLVDDVLTTGSTMKSIALLLKEHLAKHIYVCTLARA